MQTTLPKAVKTVLGLDAGSRVGYVIEGNTVRLVNADARAEHEDPALQPFLALLGRDLEEHPERLQAFPEELLAVAAEARGRVAVDHDEEIVGAVAL
jgi:antitoxin PrlF